MMHILFGGSSASAMLRLAKWWYSLLTCERERLSSSPYMYPGRKVVGADSEVHRWSRAEASTSRRVRPAATTGAQ